MKSKLLFLFLLLVVSLSTAVYAYVDCSPNSCPAGYSDGGVTCSGDTCTRICSKINDCSPIACDSSYVDYGVSCGTGDCTRSCYADARCSDSWSHIFYDSDEEKNYDSFYADARVHSDHYYPSGTKCYKSVYDAYFKVSNADYGDATRLNWDYIIEDSYNNVDWDDSGREYDDDWTFNFDEETVLFSPESVACSSSYYKCKTIGTSSIKFENDSWVEIDTVADYVRAKSYLDVYESSWLSAGYSNKSCQKSNSVDNQSCQRKECNPSDPCCNSDGTLKSQGTICQANILTESQCNGNAVEERSLNYICSGMSSSCTVDYFEFTNWLISEQCAVNQLCLDSTCVNSNNAPKISYFLTNDDSVSIFENALFVAGIFDPDYDTLNVRFEIDGVSVVPEKDMFEYKYFTKLSEGEHIAKVIVSDSEFTVESNTISVNSINPFAKNPMLFLGNEFVWEKSGVLDEDMTVSGFENQVNDFLKDCVADAQGYCDVPISLMTDNCSIASLGKIEIFYLPYNSPPEILTVESSNGNSMYIRESNIFSVSAVDSDSNLSYQWYFNGELVSRDNTFILYANSANLENPPVVIGGGPSQSEPNIESGGRIVSINSNGDMSAFVTQSVFENQVFLEPGDYNIMVFAIDELSYDSKNLLFSIESNSPPEIIATTPEWDVNILPNESFVFSVDAIDTDNDPLTYVWEINGRRINSKSFNTKSILLLSGQYSVTLEVSDGYSVVEKNFSLNVISSVPDSNIPIRVTKPITLIFPNGNCSPPFVGPCPAGTIYTSCGCKDINTLTQGKLDLNKTNNNPIQGQTIVISKPITVILPDGECSPPFVGPCPSGTKYTSCGCKENNSLIVTKKINTNVIDRNFFPSDSINQNTLVSKSLTTILPSGECSPPFVGPCPSGTTYTSCGCK